MLQIRTPFYCLFRFKFLKDNLEMLHPGCSYIVQSRYDPDSYDIMLLMQYGYTPDTAVILPFIQTSAIRYAPDTEAILFLIRTQLSITLPNGIYKPIPDKVLSHPKMTYISPSSYPSSLQMASVSPFPLSHC